VNPVSHPILEVKNVSAGYGAADVLHGVELSVHEGQICVVVGANGAGKSTLLATIAGIVRPTEGSVRFDGAEVTRTSVEEISRSGLVHVPEGHRVFRGMTVRENLDLGLWKSGLSRDEEADRLAWVLQLFPFLQDRMKARAEVLSGGEQQMLAIGQALMQRPKVLLLDEPSLGLAPIMIEKVLDAVETLRREGLTIVLVEQVVERALAIADWGYVLRTGVVVADGPGKSLLSGPGLEQAYLGHLDG
jgi:branched-chain amino acid transport system ATP-binding protein